MQTCVRMRMNSTVPSRAGGSARQIVNKKLSFLTQYVTNQANSIKKGGGEGEGGRKKKKGIFITSP